MDPKTLRQRHLRREVGAAAETVDTERAAGWNRRGHQCAIADDAGAQQGSDVLVVKPGLQRVPERLDEQTEVCVAAITAPAGEGGRTAQILGPVATESAAAISAAEPSDTDPVTRCKPACAITEGIDDSNYFVTRGDAGMLGQQVPFGEVQIGAADAAAGDLDADLPGKRGRHSAFHLPQRFTLNRPRLVYGPGVHLAILTIIQG